jgi:hypothetical protein
MKLRIVGVGLTRTGTSSLKVAFEHLLGRRCYHMSVIPGHPFDLALAETALAGEAPDRDRLFDRRPNLNFSKSTVFDTLRPFPRAHLQHVKDKSCP